MTRKTPRKSGELRRWGTIGSGRELSISLPQMLSAGSDWEFRQLIQDMLGLSIRLQATREIVAKMAKLTGPQYSLLVAISYLERMEPGVTIRRLADHLHVSGTYVTAEANKLLQSGLLAKRPNPGDGRSVFLTLTNTGRQKIDRLLPVIRTANDTIFRRLDGKAFHTLRRQMADMVATAEEALLVARHQSASGAIRGPGRISG